MKNLSNAIYGLALLGAVSTAPATGFAAEMSTAKELSSNVTQSVRTVQFGRCAEANRLCRARWGFGPRYRRCMEIRNCL